MAQQQLSTIALQKLLSFVVEANEELNGHDMDGERKRSVVVSLTIARTVEDFLSEAETQSDCTVELKRSVTLAELALHSMNKAAEAHAAILQVPISFTRCETIEDVPDRWGMKYWKDAKEDRDGKVPLMQFLFSEQGMGMKLSILFS